MNKKLTPFAAVMLGVIVFAGQFLAGALLQAQDFSAASTDRVSQGTFSGATEPAAASINSRMSKNGRFIVFESTAGNLNRAGLPFNPTPGRRHVYLYESPSRQPGAGQHDVSGFGA